MILALMFNIVVAVVDLWRTRFRRAAKIARPERPLCRVADQPNIRCARNIAEPDQGQSVHFASK